MKETVGLHLLLVGSLLQLGELDLHKRIQVKRTDTSSRSLSCSSKGLLGAALDRHLLALLPEGLLDHLLSSLPQGGGGRLRWSLLGAWSLRGLLSCRSRLGRQGFLGASFGSLLGSSRVWGSHVLTSDLYAGQRQTDRKLGFVTDLRCVVFLSFFVSYFLLPHNIFVQRMCHNMCSIAQKAKTC